MTKRSKSSLAGHPITPITVGPEGTYWRGGRPFKPKYLADILANAAADKLERKQSRERQRGDEEKKNKVSESIFHNHKLKKEGSN